MSSFGAKSQANAFRAQAGSSRASAAQRSGASAAAARAQANHFDALAQAADARGRAARFREQEAGLKRSRDRQRVGALRFTHEHPPRSTVGERGAPATGTVGQGIVRDLQWQVEAHLHINVCRFRIERRNAAGDPLPSVPVEMRSMSFKGNISSGDWVEVREQWIPGQVLRPHRVENLTTKTPFASTYGVVNKFQAFPILFRHPMVLVAGLLGVAAVVVVLYVEVFSTGIGVFKQVQSITSVEEHAAFSLSRSSGTPNGKIAVSGAHWLPRETVIFRYGPEEVGQAVANSKGVFSNATITIPSNANGFFRTITATGEGTSVGREEQFTVTGVRNEAQELMRQAQESQRRTESAVRQAQANG